MAIKFTDTSNRGFTNTWTQLKNVVSGKSLYNADDYENLSPKQKENYLLMLYQNNDALSQRLPEEYQSEYGTADTRYALLMATNNKYSAQLAAQSPEYQQQLKESVDKQLNSAMAADVNIENSWVKWLVDNRYDGNYAAFVSDYSGDNAKTYENALTEMIPADYEFDEESFKAGVEDTINRRNTLETATKNQASDNYSNVLQYVKAQLKENAQRQAYEDASALEKVANTIWQIPTLWAAETVEILEGVGDTLLTVCGMIAPLVDSSGELSNAYTEAIKYDWWSADTWLLSAAPASYLSKYADDNIAKWIHEIGVNIVDMAPLALNAVAPGVGTAVYYSSSFGKNMEGELQQGYSFSDAVIYTAGATAIEYATEKLSGSKFFGGGVFKKWENFGAKNLAAKIAHDALGEGLEEVVSGIGSDLWHGTVTGDITLDTKEGWLQIGKSFLIGGLVGGIMAGGNEAVMNHIITKTAVTLKNADGRTISLSGAKAAIVQDYVRRIDKKIADGGHISERTRRRFDILKNMKVVDSDLGEQLMKAMERSARTGKAISFDDLTPSRVDVRLQAGYYVPTKPKTDAKESFKEKVKRLAEEAKDKSADSSTYEFIDDSGITSEELASTIVADLDAESKEKLRQDFVASGTITLSKLLRMFGEDAFMNGVKLWAQYQEKTLDQVVEMLEIGSDRSVYNKEDTDTSKLSEAFNGAEFIVVQPKKATTVAAKYTELESTMSTLRKALKHFGVANKIKLFFTTSETVSTSFFIDKTLYISADWLATTNVDTIKDIVTCKYCAEDARRILNTYKSSESARTLLLETIGKIDNPGRSAEIMLQELAFVMLFTKNNILMQQMMAYAPDESGMQAIEKYFDDLRQKYAARPVQKATGLALSNMQACCEELYETGSDPDTSKTLPEDRFESMTDILDSYRQQSFRAFPFITGKNGVKRNMAKINAMYLHFKNVYGFNKKLDLTKRINWIKQLTDPKNYDGDGFARLSKELENYRTVNSTTGYARITVAQNKTLGELLNYYIDNTCGLMVFSNGVITESELTTRILNIKALAKFSKQYAEEYQSSREPIGMVSDFLTDYANDKLPAAVHNVPVYLTFDSGSQTNAYITGDTNSSMAIVINISNIESSETMITAGGKQLVLDENGELIKDSNGNFRVTDYTYSISKLSYTIGHEIGHCIGMMLGFNGTLNDTDLANAYGKRVSKLSYEDVNKFIDSIEQWLMQDGKVKDSMLRFAAQLGVSKADIESKAEIAYTKIEEFIKKLKDKLWSFKNDAKNTATLLQPLAEHLYFTGLANEMFANGKAESVARADVLHSASYSTELGKQRISGTRIIAESNLYFIQLLDGYSILGADTEYIRKYISAVQDSPENTTRRLYGKVETLEELKTELNVKLDSQLIDPQFWIDKANAKSEDVSRSKLIDSIEQEFDCTYDNTTQEFKSGYVSKFVRDDYDTVPHKNEDYSVVVLSNGQLVNTKNTSAFSTGANVDTLIRYSPKSGNRPANLTVRLIKNTFSAETKQLITLLYNWSDGNVNIIAGGRLFNNMPAAQRYLSQKATPSNPDFDVLFEDVVSGSVSIGRQSDYTGNVIYMTTDGKIYNSDFNMADWHGYAETLKLPESLLGQYTQDESGNFKTDNPEGISYSLSKLFDSKRVLRLYRDGESWKAYGVPNLLQDDFIRELKAERQSMTPYEIEIKADRKLFVASKRNSLDVEIHSLNWSHPDFKEVEWHGDKWYSAICQIATKYNLTSIQDFELLGFSQSFIDRLKSVEGVRYEDILEYIRDGANTDLSKNVLIENTPQSDRETGTGNWKDNPHIYTIELAKEYWNLAKTYNTILNDDKVYSSVLELKQAMEKARTDPANRAVIESSSQLCQYYEKRLQLGEIYIQLLNQDARINLTLSKQSFEGIIKYIGAYVGKATKRLTKEVNIEVEDEDGHTRYLGESEETPAEFEIKEDDPYAEDYKGFMSEIADAEEIADADERNRALQDILDSLEYERYKNFEYKEIIRNTVINKMEGTDLELRRRKELERTERRVEKYKELEADSEEQLQERASLIRLYERTKNRRLKNISKGSTTYHERYLQILAPIGAYRVNMSEKFSNLYAKASKVRERVGNKEAFDKNLNRIKELREALLKVDMEYPGWYKTYENLLQMAQDWLNGKTETNGMSFKAMQTDIINFINKYETDAEFRQKIAAREKADDYIFVRRGAVLNESDLERFRDIPENIEDISKFPKEARELYDTFAKGEEDVTVLASILSDPDSVTQLLKLYGQDFIYNLQKLYNELIAPPPGSGISKAKKDVLSGVLKKAGAKDETIAKTVKPLEKKISKTQADSLARKASQDRLLDYREFVVDYVAKTHDFLAAGEEVTDTERTAALKRAATMITDYRWTVMVEHIPTSMSLYDLGTDKFRYGKAYKIITALMHSYYEFIDNPKTDRSIDKFIQDVWIALEEQRINAVVPGSTKPGKHKERIAVRVPESLKKPFTVEAINKRLEPIFKGILKDADTSYAEKIAAFRNTIATEREAVAEHTASITRPRTFGDSIIDDMAKRRKQILEHTGVTTINPTLENITYDNGFFHYPNSDNPLRATPDYYSLYAIPQSEWDKYIADQINKGLSDGRLKRTKKGNIVDAETKRIVIHAEDAENLSSIPDEDDFESDETPSEDDFTDGPGVSKLIEDDMDFEPLEFEEKPEQPKGSWVERSSSEPTDLRSGLSDNTIRMLNYVPLKSQVDGTFVWNSRDFLTDNTKSIANFTTDAKEMEAFVSKIESGPSIALNSPEEMIIFALLNQISNSIDAPRDLQVRADSLIKQLAARAGRTLGAIKAFGVTPVDQLVGLCSKYLELDEGERTTLSNAATAQKAAITSGDYNTANEIMNGVLDIIRKHKAELPVSMNVFASGLSDEERTTRWHNIVEKVTSWRYFAMLGSPTTFFTKNITSNVIITGMDNAAELIAKLMPQGKTLSTTYSFTDAQFDPFVIQGKELKLLNSTDVESIVNTLFIDKADRSKIDIAKLTKKLNGFIKTRYDVQKKMPTAGQVASHANAFLRETFYQYRMDIASNEAAKEVVDLLLVKNGLLDGIMSDQVAKYDRGYDAKIGKLRNIALNEDTNFEELSEADASLLADAVSKDSPFKFELLNRYYRFIFKTMELGDKKFIRPKIINTLEKLVASNMTAEEIAKLRAGDKATRAKFNDFIAYATNDALKTYFRGESDLQVKVMRMLNGKPIAQLIFGTIVPFPRMMMNTMGTALSYSPVGFLKALTIAHGKQDSFTRLKVNKELGKAFTGTALMAVGVILAACGAIAFDDDDKFGGPQLVVGDKLRIALDDLMPSASPLIIGATMADAKTEGFWKMAYAGGDALLDATLLGEAIEIFGGNKESIDVITDTFSSFVNQFVPSAMRHVARVIDPTEKKYSSNKGFKIIQRVAAAIPGASLLVPSKVDPYTGKAIYQNAESSEAWARVLSFANLLSPAKITLDIESDVEKESKAVGANTTGPARVYKINGVDYEIPDDLYRDYQILRAKLYSSYAQNIIGTPAYQRMTIAQKKSTLARLQTKATNEARKQLNIGK